MQIENGVKKAKDLVDFQEKKRKKFEGSFRQEKKQKVEKVEDKPKGEKYQGVLNLNTFVGIHQMSKEDRKFTVKRRDRIDDMFEKDVLGKQMKQEGYYPQR